MNFPPLDPAAPPVAHASTTAPDGTEQRGTIRLCEEYEAALAEAPLVPPSGGDFHQAFRLPDGSAAVVLGDVSGHGPEAAAHAERLKTAISGCLAEGVAPAEALGFVNAAAEMDPDFPGFATVFAGRIAPETGVLTYASGGHEPALVADGGKSAVVCELESTGPPVGAIGGETARYEQQETFLPEGGTLLLYTDGATEARRGGLFLGFEGFRALFARFAYLSPARLTSRLLGRVRAFAGGPGLRDDIALLAVRRHRPTNDQ